MEYKKNIETVLESLKNAGWERKDIEQELRYSENYINQQLSKGGNKRLLKALEDMLQKATSGQLKKPSSKHHSMRAEPGNFSLSATEAISVYQRMAERSEEHATRIALQAEEHTRRVAEQAEKHAQRLENIIIAQLTSMDKKLDTISSNSIQSVAGVKKLIVHSEGREETILESLSRLEKKKPDALKQVADNKIVEKIKGNVVLHIGDEVSR